MRIYLPTLLVFSLSISSILASLSATASETRRAKPKQKSVPKTTTIDLFSEDFSTSTAPATTGPAGPPTPLTRGSSGQDTELVPQQSGDTELPHRTHPIIASGSLVDARMQTLRAVSPETGEEQQLYDSAIQLLTDLPPVIKEWELSRTSFGSVAGYKARLDAANDLHEIIRDYEFYRSLSWDCAQAIERLGDLIAERLSRDFPLKTDRDKASEEFPRLLKLAQFLKLAQETANFCTLAVNNLNLLEQHRGRWTWDEEKQEVQLGGSVEHEYKNQNSAQWEAMKRGERASESLDLEIRSR